MCLEVLCFEVIVKIILILKLKVKISRLEMNSRGVV